MKPTVCVDVDGVLAKYDGWRGCANIGEPIAGAVKFTHDLGKLATVVIYTTRCKVLKQNAQELRSIGEMLQLEVDPETAWTDPILESVAKEIVKRWLDKHGFHYDDIYIGEGKPMAVAYVDDRAVPCRPQDYSEEGNIEFQYKKALVDVKSLCRGW